MARPNLSRPADRVGNHIIAPNLGLASLRTASSSRHFPGCSFPMGLPVLAVHLDLLEVWAKAHQI